MCERVQVSKAVDRFIGWLALRAREKTVEFYRRFLERFVCHVGDCPLSDVRRLDVETFAATFHPLAAVRRFLRWCADVAELLPRDPAANVRVPRNGQRSRVLSRLERVVIRRRCSPALRAALVALEETAMRPQELRALTWQCLFGPGGPARIRAALGDGRHWFQLEEYKGRNRRADGSRPRVIVITPRLGRLLERLARSDPPPTDHVFNSPSGRPWTANALRCAFRRLRSRLAQAGRVDSVGIVPYTYRHTRASALARDGVNAMLLKEWMGHSRVETTARYCHFALQEVSAIGRRRWK